ncbi:heme ABC transporter ATP-binding protein [Corynebacterium sp. 153RC1]|uniref:heme ABC transporter ATP-binding protein n=1 Tax=Corynebacterium TaxID=1716 RepID=UPI00211C8748|nr:MULTISPECIES: heme ABC transporter ATP-binding protein [unclassified Corynebacterium]MCQ9370843.1 heme ABC transporter ATP-binding protein [Corynebacterium sp. 35RC1]MCQ9342952.1 heme ABC transporter ATP-binding protein [Corynebacterium sp. 76QC2CO]MCQ9352672.1 heme ABC transporter ATP-binding protein [Corynebacterium sp. 209RC1]MCQ9354856.1 heme ABC transporter ATP-binding protein [Corynebacterium sp. 1222RC1]MCQ9357041.1 heme ABC transporter ATP-binding protein [Corynebacterium sp. 122RC1
MITVEQVEIQVNNRRLLHNITFTAQPGQVTGLIGPNGAGKSTLLASISGDLKPTAGQIRVANLDPYATDPATLARSRAVMLQDTAVAFEYLARDIVAMGQRVWARPNEELIDAAMAATDTMHLGAREVPTLSGGERARVALARVLAQNAPVILLDEPTAALDISHQLQVLHLIRELARRTQATVLVVLHDLNAAAAFCNHIVCVSNGGIAALGSVEEVYTSEVLSQVYQYPLQVSRQEGHIQVIPQQPSLSDFQSIERILDFHAHDRSTNLPRPRRNLARRPNGASAN